MSKHTEQVSRLQHRCTLNHSVISIGVTPSAKLLGDEGPLEVRGITVSLPCVCFCFCSRFTVCNCPFHVPFDLHEMTQRKRRQTWKMAAKLANAPGRPEKAIPKCQAVLSRTVFPTRRLTVQPLALHVQITRRGCRQPPGHWGAPHPRPCWLRSDRPPAPQPRLGGALSNFPCAEPALLCSPN